MKGKIRLIITVVFLLLGVAGCGGGGGASAPVDTIPPTATALPGSGSIIGGSSLIVVAFSESMNTASLVVSGNMATESDGGTWSATTRENDTLTIRPNLSWSGGDGRTLILDAADRAGNPLATLTLTYGIDTTPPVAVASPLSGSIIGKTRQIVISFTKAMDPASLSLGGTLAPASDGGLWSSKTFANDTLTISPVSGWNSGAGTLSVNAVDKVGNPLATLSLSYVVDSTLPTAGISPANGSILANASQIVITFSESMSTGILSVVGLDTKYSTWSTTVVANDTLTISPATEWVAGTNRPLSVYAEDLVGNPITVSLVYDVAIVYVKDSGGSDANAGTRNLPMKTISAAIARADALYTKARIHVASGTYSVSTAVTLVEGISLFGGYSSTSWDLRNSQTYVTTIQDTRTTGGTQSAPNAAVSAGSGITMATLIDGFTILGGGGTYSSAVFNGGGSPTVNGNVISGGSGSNCIGIYNRFSSSPVITNNTISGGSGSSSSYGIQSFGATSPMISGNTINGGSGASSAGIGINGSSDLIHSNSINGGSGTYPAGVFVANTSTISAPVIRNNTVSGGAGTGSAGIRNTAGSTAIIQSNTISGGSGGTYSYGLTIESGSSPALPQIINNIIFTSSGTSRYCVYEWTVNSRPATMQNNDLFDCPTALYGDADGGGKLMTISAMEADIVGEGRIASGNVSTSPAFVNQAGGDWHLTASSPVSVTRGGLDLSMQFTIDKDGASRTVPWSMGAYERD